MIRLLAIGVGAFLLIGSNAAEAARCPQGKIYRPSMGVCQSKQAAIRDGAYRSRPKKVRVKYVRPPKAKTVKPSPNPIVDYHRHVQSWADRNRASIIRSLEHIQ